MKEFKREFAVYTLAILAAYVMSYTGIAYRLQGIVPAYVEAQLAALPLFVILAAQFYMAKSVYEDSFEHELDYDWWMIVPLLGPIGVLIYYLDRESKL